MTAYTRDDGTIRGGRVFGTVVAVIAVMLAAGLAIYAVTYFTADARGRIALHNKVRSADELQASYEYFHDTCRDIIAKGQQLTTLGAQLTDMRAHPPASDPFGQYQQQVVQVEGQVTGLSNARDSAAQAYDAKSHEFTHNFMRSHDLPVEIGPPSGVPYDALRCENQGS